MLVELFPLGVTAEALRAKNISKIGEFETKFQVERVDPTNHFCMDS